MSGIGVTLAVIGSVNLDMTARVRALPRPGETVTNGELLRCPGGKGGNQALAARRLGARTSLVACVGDDAAAGEALALLRTDGVDLSLVVVDPGTPTGVALIAVDDAGENQIVVAPGANRRLSPERLALPEAGAMICQLEVPVETLKAVASEFAGFLCLNLAPVQDIPDSLVERADLVVVNELEAAHFGDRLHRAGGFVAVTGGARGATLCRGAAVVAEHLPPAVLPVDTTGAGDTFTAALTLALAEGQAPQVALAFACTAAALSTTRRGAQPSMPWRNEVDALMANSQQPQERL